MKLRDLIEWLEMQNPDLIVSDGFCDAHSDRGYYDHLAFDPVPKARIGDMLKIAKWAVGKTLDGYNGGDYVMDLDTPICIGEWGVCGEPITQIHLKYWALTASESE